VIRFVELMAAQGQRESVGNAIKAGTSSLRLRVQKMQ
jgi:hypothetical protein